MTLHNKIRTGEITRRPAGDRRRASLSDAPAAGPRRRREAALSPSADRAAAAAGQPLVTSARPGGRVHRLAADAYLEPDCHGP